MLGSGPFAFQEEVTAFEAPSRLTRVTDVKGLPFSHEGGSIRLEPESGGTHALWTSNFEIPIPLIGGVLERDLSRRRLRARLRQDARAQRRARDLMK